jgi:hypothetical protein
MNLPPCPLCGESKGGYIASYVGSVLPVCCAACHRAVAYTRDRHSADEAWNAAAAHAQGLRERIAELEAQRVPQWISVDDRLPEKFIEVLICFAGQFTLCATGQYTDNHRHDVAGWCYPAENRGCTDSGDDPVVTHWMPLPLPPGERAHGIEDVKR